MGRPYIQSWLNHSPKDPKDYVLVTINLTTLICLIHVLKSVQSFESKEIDYNEISINIFI